MDSLDYSVDKWIRAVIVILIMVSYLENFWFLLSIQFV